MDELTEEIIQKGGTHFLEMSGGDINATELVATLINQKDNLIEGIRYAQERIDGARRFFCLHRTVYTVPVISWGGHP